MGQNVICVTQRGTAQKKYHKFFFIGWSSSYLEYGDHNILYIIYYNIFQQTPKDIPFYGSVNDFKTYPNFTKSIKF